MALNPKLEDLGKAEPDSKSAPDADAPRLCNYGQLEKWLWVELFALGRLFIELFVASARMVLGKQLGKASSRARPRQFKGRFGTISYWREGSCGHFPLDNLLGIGRGGFSHSVCLLACNLATRMSFAVSAKVLERFAGCSPDPGSIENMVLGVGASEPTRRASWNKVPPKEIGANAKCWSSRSMAKLLRQPQSKN